MQRGVTMFNKKELEEIKEQVDLLSKEIHGKFEQHQKNLLSHNAHTNTIFNQIQTNISELQRKNFYFTDTFEEQVQKFKTLGDKLKSTIESFKLLENVASKKLMEEMQVSIENEIKNLSHTSNKYKELEEKLSATQKRLVKIEDQLDRFLELAGKIKESDFELSRYANELRRNDKEKLELMRENEKLKTLIARERRGIRK